MKKEDTETLTAKKELALELIERLKEAYPDAGCTLDYDDAWKLLVSVRLAAQCTDARVNVVVEKLYEKYPDVNALAEADVDCIEEIVRPCGLGRSKAKDISACMKILKEQYGGKVPDNFDALLKLPGVGRKSANLIMGDGTGRRNQRAEKGGDGSVETDSSGGGQRLLSSAGVPRKRRMYGKDKTAL